MLHSPFIGGEQKILAMKMTCVTMAFFWLMYYLQKHVDFMCSSMFYDLTGPLYRKIQTACTCGCLQSPLTSLDKNGGGADQWRP